MVNRVLLRLFPFLTWGPITALSLRGDLVAGITGGLVLVPKAMAYAQLAGLPLQFGLYTALVPAIIGALWGSSRQLATGPTAIVSLMTSAAVLPLAVPGSEQAIGLVLLLTFAVGCIQLFLGLVKLGSAVNFVAHPVILGFMNAAALIIGLSQVDVLFGIPKGRSDFFLKDIWEMLEFIPLVHLPTLAMSLFSLALMLLVKRIAFLAKPGILLVLTICTIISALIGFEHDDTAPVTTIDTAEVRYRVRHYEQTSAREKALRDQQAELAGALRQAERSDDFRQVAELRYRLDLTEIDLATLETENQHRLRAIRKVYFVRGQAEAGGLLYKRDAAPENVETDGRHWRIRKIENGVLHLRGGGEVVGAIPAGLPAPRLPAFSLEGMMQLTGAALVIALVAFMESISMAKAMASKTKQRIDPNQELIGQGLANIGGSFFQSYPACGSFTGSAINLQTGARTGLAMVINGAFVAITLVFFTASIYHLPKAVLAVVILLAVTGLITPRAFLHTWRASRSDGAIAVVTFVVTLLAAPHLDKGIFVGALLAIGYSLYRTMAPRVAILGRHEDGSLRDTKHHPNLMTSSKVVLIRFDGSLYFANVAHFEDAVLRAVADNHEVRYLLVVADGINHIDSSGEEALHNLVTRLRQTGVDVAFSGIKKQVLDVLQATGLFTLIGDRNIFTTEHQALCDLAGRLDEEDRHCGLFRS
ncbi:MAG: SulP family inorganic anion transporter [Desulfobulbus sp.]|jgi:SulP family sulfate permease